MQLQLPILLAFVTLAVAFPKKPDGKKGDSPSDGQPWDGDHGKDDGKPWDPDHHDGKNRTICISIPDGSTWSAVGPDGSQHSFDDLKWDSGSDGSDSGGY